MIKPYTLHLGDCIEVMRTLADNSVDAIVTDPPYHLTNSGGGPAKGLDNAYSRSRAGATSTGFMGQAWDGGDIAQRVELWAEALRVLKPGGHLLAFSGTRTSHRMVCAIEDAGFEIRDSIPWIYGSGFPKSMNVSKAIDGHVTGGRSDSLALKQVNETRPGEATIRPTSTNGHRGIVGSADAGQSVKRATPATREGEQWNGWGTALKPAHEPCCMARKPLIGTVAANVLAHGTGALNIDGCRVAGEQMAPNTGKGALMRRYEGDQRQAAPPAQPHDAGRWPANIIHDGSAEVVALFPAQAGASAPVRGTEASAASVGRVTGERARVEGVFHGDTGSAARFFYCAKASKSDRDAGLTNEPVPFVQFQTGNGASGKPSSISEGRETEYRNTHPTVKPTDLMAYLVRLVTPPGGVVLDPFMGSGSTGKACMREGFRFIGIDLTAEYLPIAEARIEHELATVTAAAAAAVEAKRLADLEPVQLSLLA